MTDTGSSTSFDLSWKDIFPYEEAYDAQEDGIEEVLDTAYDDGFVLLEGACGTGKTLIALSAGLRAVRDPESKYERVMCMTSVKQQLKAFEDDIEAINNNLPEGVRPVQALSMVGKADVCSYVDTGHIDRDDIYQSCETLRDQVRAAVRRSDDEVDQLNDIIGSWQADAEDALKQEGEWETDYATDNPMQAEEIGCAFYARYLRDKRLAGEDEAVLELDGLNTPEELTRKASNAGLCPHSIMIDSLERSEVLIGNYRHAFDPRTVEAMTGKLLDDETFVVCDEAHTIIEVVRGLLSEDMSLFALDRALKNELDLVMDPSTTTQENFQRLALDELTDLLDVSSDDAKRYIAMYHGIVKDVREKLINYATAASREEFGNGWNRIIKSGKNLPQTIEKPLRNPEIEEEDELSEWIEQSGYPIWDDVGQIGAAIAEAIKEASKRDSSVSTKVQTYCDTIGRVLARWQAVDNKAHFREVELVKRREEWSNPDHAWEAWYNPKFTLKNCIPRDGISETLKQFGGGILMSATLEPFDAYKQEIGFRSLDRPVKELSYGLNFPEENRASLIADVEKFTSRNRGDPSDENELRQVYAQIIKDVASTTQGNVLVGMPSYNEGRWAAEVLEESDEVDKQVLSDQSSSNTETEELKQRFFRGDSKVLVTSMRGTLTEGVDYDGDRLSGCVVCGLPIRGMGSPHATAIETAYKSRFGDFEGFAYAFAVPALRKARQALGRVIRSADDIGVRVMADGRYTRSGYLRQYMPDYEKRDYDVTEPYNIRPTLNSFWRRRG